MTRQGLAKSPYSLLAVAIVEQAVRDWVRDETMRWEVERFLRSQTCAMYLSSDYDPEYLIHALHTASDKTLRRGMRQLAQVNAQTS